MFIVACFSRETRNTTATSEAVTTLANSNRRVRNVTRAAKAAVTAMANQNRGAMGSVQDNKTRIAPSSASAAVTATTRCIRPVGMIAPWRSREAFRLSASSH